MNRAYTVSLLDGLKNVGYSIDKDVQAKYEAYKAKCEKEKAEKAAKDSTQFLMSFLPQPLPAEILPTTDELTAAVSSNDAAIITLGRISGEFLDRTRDNFNLSAEELQLIKNVSRAFQAAGKKVIVVLNIGGVIETASWNKIPDAVLLAWQAGQEGGNSVADVLAGKVSPSGKLPMTWPVKLEDHASTKNFPRAEDFKLDLSIFMGGENKEGAEQREFWDYTNHSEGIFIGYRWFDKQNLAVSYPFGYGLSYTTFEYSNAKVSVANGKVTVTVDVKNTGAVEAKEVVEVYATAPGKDMDKPAKELRAYAKTRSLKLSESETVTMTFAETDLASYSSDKSAWVVEAGNYAIHIGATSRDIRAQLDLTIAAAETKTNDVLRMQK